MTRTAAAPAFAFALAAAIASGCSWHRAGEANLVAPPPAELAAPRAGLSLGEAIALAEAEEQGDFSTDAEVLRVAKIADGIWEDVPTRAARNGTLPLDANAEYVVIAHRTCSDWTTDRDRWSDDRASWFLFADGTLVAYDHWNFGAHCGLANAFRPAPPDSPSRATERDLLRWLEQRHPPGRIPIELRVSRGRAFAQSGRLEEARALLRFADDEITTREDLFEAREKQDDGTAEN
jgi:hypothetical protein